MTQVFLNITGIRSLSLSGIKKYICLYLFFIQTRITDFSCMDLALRLPRLIPWKGHLFSKARTSANTECKDYAGHLANPESTIVLAWKPYQHHTEFTLSGHVGQENQYVAMGLSKDEQMVSWKENYIFCAIILLHVSLETSTCKIRQYCCNKKLLNYIWYAWFRMFLFLLHKKQIIEITLLNYGWQTSFVQEKWMLYLTGILESKEKDIRLKLN